MQWVEMGALCVCNGVGGGGCVECSWAGCVWATTLASDPCLCFRAPLCLNYMPLRTLGWWLRMIRACGCGGIAFEIALGTLHMPT